MYYLQMHLFIHTVAHLVHLRQNYITEADFMAMNCYSGLFVVY